MENLSADNHSLSNYFSALWLRLTGCGGPLGSQPEHGHSLIQIGGCSIAQHLAVKEHYALFQPKDTYAWLLFLVVFVALITFDNMVLHRKNSHISFTRACCYSTFWVFCGVCFNVYVYTHRGWGDALSWSTGYLLEWMLSMDCLFFFHIIFKLLGTPDHLKQIPLFWGITMAIAFRLVFFLTLESMMHSLYATHLIFGLFLIYTGFKSVSIDEENFDPRENALFRFMFKYIRIVNNYDADGRMFVRVNVDPTTGEPIEPTPTAKMAHGKLDQHDLESTKLATGSQWYGSPRGGMDRQPVAAGAENYQWRGTLLVVVVMCILITDLIFAVDSVSAVVAEIPDLFLAYTASVFAVLNLRAMFFVTDELIKHFVLLKYGIASILVIIGTKLICKEWVHIPAFAMLSVLIGIVTCSIVGSIALNYYRASQARSEAAPGTGSTH